MATTPPKELSGPAALVRRLASIIYDLFLVLAILFIITAIAVALNRGQAVSHPLYYVLMLLAAGAFYIGFWYYAGQTLGMRAWGYRLVSANLRKPGLWPCMLRAFFALPTIALAGTGLLWLLFDKQRRTLYDRLSGTHFIRSGNN